MFKGYFNRTRLVASPKRREARNGRDRDTRKLVEKLRGREESDHRWHGGAGLSPRCAARLAIGCIDVSGTRIAINHQKGSIERIGPGWIPWAPCTEDGSRAGLVRAFGCRIIMSQPEKGIPFVCYKTARCARGRVAQPATIY